MQIQCKRTSRAAEGLPRDSPLAAVVAILTTPKSIVTNVLQRNISRNKHAGSNSKTRIIIEIVIVIVIVIVNQAQMPMSQTQTETITITITTTTITVTAATIYLPTIQYSAG